MATFRRRGTIGRLERKMIDRMVERGYQREFAERCFNQIKGFGEYGFPESHAASFAHLVYVSSWLKCHYPAAFCAAILNSQPMGFYAPGPACARCPRAWRHGACAGCELFRWDCTLEGDAGRPPQVRLGLRLVDGLKETDGKMVPVHHPYTSLHSPAPLGHSHPAIIKLAEADAFRSIGIDRRQALWQARALAKAKPLPLFAHADAEDAGEDTPCHLAGDGAGRACGQ
jgi:error-prone DNA polymerase